MKPIEVKYHWLFNTLRESRSQRDNQAYGLTGKEYKIVWCPATLLPKLAFQEPEGLRAKASGSEAVVKLLRTAGNEGYEALRLLKP